jgi:exopolysaccharide biosynthesis polyprenyl glycosylphosphotransferase
MLRQQSRTLHYTLVVADALLSSLLFALVFALPWAGEPLDSPDADQVWVGAVLAAIAWPLALRWVGAYRSHRVENPLRVARTLGAGALTALLLLLGGAFALRLHRLDPLALVIFSAVNLVALGGMRVAVFAGLRGLRRRGYNYRNVVMLGTGPRARRLAAEIEAHPAWGLRIRGFADDDPRPADLALVGARYLGPMRGLVDLIRSETIDEVLFALPRRWIGQESTANAQALCEVYGIDFTLASDLFDSRVAEPRFHEALGVPCLTLGYQRQHQGWQPAVKRAIDVLGALAAILLTSPLWLAAAIAIKLDSRGPVFFRQIRCGRGNRPFRVIKFRTMIADAEKLREALQRQNEIAGPVFKLKNDPRLTRVGRVLRKYSIDELPQFVNVLVGQMSLVGPRPPIPAEVDTYEPDQLRRLSVRPGITGLWQVSGRNRITFEDWVKLDLQYIDEWSLWLDFQIMLATIPAVLGGEGAS